MSSTPFTTTPNLGIGKFHDGDRPGENELNSMRDKIDRLMTMSGTIANRPIHAVTIPPRFYYSTDEGLGKLYRDDPTNGWQVVLENVPLANIVGGMSYKGVWNATSGSYPANPIKGDFYKVSVAGIFGGITYSVNDHIIYNGAGWDQISNADITTPAGALTQDQVDHIQFQDAGSHPTDNFASFDSTGKLKDSGKKGSDIDDKMAKPGTPVTDNLVAMDASGNGKDSGIAKSAITSIQTSITDIQTALGTAQTDISSLESEVEAIDVDGKMNKIATPTAGDILTTDSEGQATDSGKTIATQVNNTDNEIPTGAAVHAFAQGKAVTFTEGNLKTFDADGNDSDIGVTVEAALTESIDKIPTSQAVHDYAPARATYPTDGHLIQFDENGDCEDSGKTVSDLAKPDFSAEYTPYSLNVPDTDPADVKIVSLTNGDIEVAGFDDATEEHLFGQMRLPADLDTAGNLTIEVCGYAGTGVASRYINLKFYYAKIADAGAIDAAFSNIISGDFLTNSSGNRDTVSLSDTISNLGFAAGDMVRFKISRIAITGEEHIELSGDWNMIHLKIETGRAVS